jgi:hypothetical protein
VTAVAPSESAKSAGTRRGLIAALPFVPAFVVAATWVVWATDGGGYFPIDRYPGALLAAGLLLTIAIARPPGALVRSPALLPLALFAAWMVWNGVSVAWTSAADNGVEGMNELLAVTVMGAVMAFTPWRPRSALGLLIAWAVAILVIAVVDLATFAATSDPGGRLLEGRYLGPIGYANGSAAIGAMAFWPLLAVAAGPRFPAAARVAALPAAVIVLAWALLPQSRGTMIGALAVVPLFVALSSHRARVLTRLAVVGGALAICVPALFDVYTASREKRGLDGVVETAVSRTGIAAALALVASVLLVAVERRVQPGERALVWIRRTGVVALVLVLLAGAGVALARQEQIRSGVSDRWDTFSSFADVVNTDTGARIGQVIPDKRYDYWKVAYNAFRDAPVVGIGAGGFEIRYAANKEYPKHSRYVHDIWLRALTETGIVGFALLVAALAAGLVALVRTRLRAEPAAHPAIAAAAALSTAGGGAGAARPRDRAAAGRDAPRRTARGPPRRLGRARGVRGARARRDDAGLPRRAQHRARGRPARERSAGRAGGVRPRRRPEPAGRRAAPEPRLRRPRPARRRPRAPQLPGCARRARGLGRPLRARAARLPGRPAARRPRADHARGADEPQRPDRHGRS